MPRPLLLLAAALLPLRGTAVSDARQDHLTHHYLKCTKSGFHEVLTGPAAGSVDRLGPFVDRVSVDLLNKTLLVKAADGSVQVLPVKSTTGGGIVVASAYYEAARRVIIDTTVSVQLSKERRYKYDYKHDSLQFQSVGRMNGYCKPISEESFERFIFE